jgi:hypothetical protein
MGIEKSEARNPKFEGMSAEIPNFEQSAMGSFQIFEISEIL